MSKLPDSVASPSELTWKLEVHHNSVFWCYRNATKFRVQETFAFLSNLGQVL